MATGLYTILEQIQVSKEEVLEAETFAKQYLRANFVDLDTREGLAIYDLVIRPTSSLLALINKGMNYYFSTNTVAGITDDSPEETVDGLMSNLFLTRAAGSSSIVRARIYFIDQNRNITIPTSATFSTDNATFFKPIVSTVLRAGLITDSPSGSFTYDASREEYFYDLDLISTSQLEDDNQEGGDFLFFSNIDPYYVGGEILYLSQRAIPKETNTEFIARSSSAISTRNLINNPSIDSIIKGTFNYVKDVVSVGHGEAEMLRDAVRLPDIVTMPGQEPVFDPSPQNVIYLNAGGKVDIYVNAPIAPQTPPELVQLDVPASTVVDGLHQSIIDIPANAGSVSYIIYHLRRATPDEALEAGLNTGFDAPLDYGMEVQCGQGIGASFIRCTQSMSARVDAYDENNALVDVGFSARQTTRIILTSPTAIPINTYKLTIRYWRFTGLLGIQEYLDDTTTRVITADYLARALDIYETNINVKRINGVALTASQLETVTALMKTYFSNQRAGQDLVVSVIVGALVRDSGISDLDVNVVVTCTKYDRYFTSSTTETITSGVKTCSRTQRFVLGEVTSNV